LNNKDFSDLKFLIKGKGNENFNEINFDYDSNNNNCKEIFAHKIILSYRVEYFRNMFSDHMIEKNYEIIEIFDYEYEIFFEFLNFVYTSEIKKKNFEIIFELFKLADNYSFESLKKYCGNLLSSFLQINHVFDVLILAYKCNSTFLEKVCIEFICQNRKKACCFLEEINNLIEYPNLMAKIIQNLANENI